MVGERRRTRRRRTAGRGLLRLAVPVVLAAVVIGLAVAAVRQISAQSGPYRRTVDRGYAALARPLVARSNASGSALRSLIARGVYLDRVAFLADLDGIAADTALVDRQFAAVTPPAPADAPAALCARTMQLRAGASAMLRNALVAVLGGRAGTGTVDVTSAVAAAQESWASLQSADASWSSCRRALRRAPGSALLPSSQWLPPATFDAATAYAWVGAVAGSPSLAAVHGLEIVAMVTDPVPVSGTGVQVLPATFSVGVQVVLADRGNVDEPGVEVGGVLVRQGAPASPVPRQRTVDLGPGGATGVTLPEFSVVPGATYSLQVTAQSSDGGPAAGSIATATLALQVQQAATSIAVSSSGDPVATGRRVTYEAVVAPAPPVGGTPTGTVSFLDDGTPVPACSARPVTRTGLATCTVTYTQAAQHSVGAAYSGDARFAGSASAAITETVAR